MAGRSASSLWMGDIDQYMDERVIAEAFSMMGEHVLSVKLLKDHKTGQNRNYCFVELTSKEAVPLALRKLTGLPLPNYPAKRFKLNYSLRDQGNTFQTAGQAAPSSTPSPYGKEFSIYVGNLNTSTTDEELLALFSHYKSIKEAKIVRDDSQNSKGFGFVRFFNDTDQEAAIMQMNGAVGPMGVTLKVDRAQPKNRDMNSGGTTGGMMPMASGATIAAYANQYQTTQYPYQGGMDPYSAYSQMGQQMPQQQQAYQPPVQATPTPAQQTPTSHPAQQPAAAAAKNEEDDETLEDHSAPVNMVATNLAYIQANQDFYKKLAESRWHPITSYSATIEEVCK
ncbi:tRNA selenocysteine 1-associated protein 1-like [Lytechinus pictus]|uniref:tRNA selenocysteine 1-associated protein 1-like n=1 Tax=Lytechinus pictus TaxID=7653 RepID=UPI0030B9D720